MPLLSRFVHLIYFPNDSCSDEKICRKIRRSIKSRLLISFQQKVAGSITLTKRLWFLYVPCAFALGFQWYPTNNSVHNVELFGSIQGCRFESLRRLTKTLDLWYVLVATQTYKYDLESEVRILWVIIYLFSFETELCDWNLFAVTVVKVLSLVVILCCSRGVFSLVRLLRSWAVIFTFYAFFHLFGECSSFWAYFVVSGKMYMSSAVYQFWYQLFISRFGFARKWAHISQ